MHNPLLNAETGRSADCQWSRHHLCLAPRECTCRCHTSTQTTIAPTCEVWGDSEECGLPAAYQISDGEGRPANVCETHRDRTVLSMLDYCDAPITINRIEASL